MPSYGQSVVLQYVAWDTANNVGKSGDAANHTLRWVKNGVSAAPSNAASEVDATNAPGVYKVTISATEAQCQVGTLCGKSSTAGIAILPVTATFENLPTATPASAGGLPTVGAGAVQIDLTQPVPTTNTAQTIGDALNGARAQAFGKWVLSGTSLTLYAADGTTVVRTFTLDSATAPTQRA